MRIAVVGSSGAGKSTLAKRMGAALGLSAIELDAINWQAGWKDLVTHDPDEFVRRVDDAIAAEAWITDGNYSRVLPAILARATHVVWLDYDRPLIMRRVIGRSFMRAWTKREIWPGTGNRETFAQWRDPDHPVLWAWRTFHSRRARFEAAFAEPELGHLEVLRLRRSSEAGSLVAQLAAERA
jgi:hypothetical protein